MVVCGSNGKFVVLYRYSQRIPGAGQAKAATLRKVFSNATFLIVILERRNEYVGKFFSHISVRVKSCVFTFKNSLMICVFHATRPLYVFVATEPHHL
jgi:hypothetical protein